MNEQMNEKVHKLVDDLIVGVIEQRLKDAPTDGDEDDEVLVECLRFYKGVFEVMDKYPKVPGRLLGPLRMMATQFATGEFKELNIFLDMCDLYVNKASEHKMGEMTHGKSN